MAADRPPSKPGPPAGAEPPEDAHAETPLEDANGGSAEAVGSEATAETVPEAGERPASAAEAGSEPNEVDELAEAADGPAPEPAQPAESQTDKEAAPVPESDEDVSPTAESDEPPPGATDDAAAATPAAAPKTRPRLAARNRAAILIGVLIAALGFAIAVQVHANSQSDSLSNLRTDDLIGILDNQNARGDRLRQQIAELQQTLRRLQDSGDRNAAAEQQAEQDATALGVLLGTLPATGPGIRVTITDPDHKLTAEDLLDVVEELRGAGAEAIQFGSVRVSTSTAFKTESGAVAVDGTVLPAPYTVLAIGDAKTLDTALNIPGGVAAAARAAGGDLVVAEQTSVTISVVRSLPSPRYASPAPH